jgi:hypothetical protein
VKDVKEMAKMTCRIPTLLALSVLVACGHDAAPDHGDDDPRTLHGHEEVLFRALDGTLLSREPQDLHDRLVEAFVPGEGGAWTHLGGTASRDGRFEVPGLPPTGHFWLHVGGHAYLWTDADTIDLDATVLGPSNPPRDEVGPASVAVDATGLAPWMEGDRLSYFVPSDVIYDDDLVGEGATSAPVAGDDALHGLAFDWTGRPLASVVAGDVALFVQYRTQTSAGGLVYSAPVRRLTLAPVQQAPQSVMHVQGAMTTPSELAYRLVWKRSAFAALAPAVSPGRATASSYAFDYSAAPGARDEEAWIDLPLPFVRLEDPADATDGHDVDSGELRLPQPFPAAWLVQSFVTTFAVDVALPDGQLATQLEVGVGRRTRRAPSASAPIVPTLTPARAPRVGAEGRSLFEPQEGIGTSPTITWDAPATGTPTSYRLRILRADPAPPPPGAPGWVDVGTFVVAGDETSLTIPPDVLARGEHYVAILKAVDEEGEDVRTSPERVSVEFAFADLVTATFAP